MNNSHTPAGKQIYSTRVPNQPNAPSVLDYGIRESGRIAPQRSPKRLIPVFCNGPVHARSTVLGTELRPFCIPFLAGMINGL
jgi:hypothetical protein